MLFSSMYCGHVKWSLRSIIRGNIIIGRQTFTHTHLKKKKINLTSGNNTSFHSMVIIIMGWDK